MSSVVRYIFQDWRINRGSQFSRSVLVTYRIGHLIARSDMPTVIKVPLKMMHRVVNAFVLKVVNAGYIQPLAEIGPNFRLPNALNGVFINAHCRIGANVKIFQQVTLGNDPVTGDWEAPTIGNDVVIGAGAKVVGGLKVGDRAVIGANSVVSKDVPADTIAVGIPARILRLGTREADGLAKSGALPDTQVRPT